MTGGLQPAIELAPQFDVGEDSLLVAGELHFNGWRAAVDQLLSAESAVQWYLGDLWVAGLEAFGLDYIPAIDQLSRRFPWVVDYARVSRAFPPRSESETLRPGTDPDPGVFRVSGVSWSHHRLCAAIVDEQERMCWVEDVLRQNWSCRELAAEIAAAKAGTVSARATSAVLSLRAQGDLASRWASRAESLGVGPKELALSVLELASQLDDPIAALSAAIAQLRLEAG